MRLIWVRLNGFRRFHKPTTLEVRSKLVALLGPNEAGKTSALDAIASLNSDDPYDRTDLTRGQPAPSGAVVEAAFFLGSDERALLADLPGGDGVNWFYVKKGVDGTREYSTSPSLSRDLSGRRSVIRGLRRAARSPAIEKSGQIDKSILTSLADELSHSADDLGDKCMNTLSSMATSLTAELTEGWPQYIRELSHEIQELHDLQQAPHPEIQAFARLKDCLPTILQFSDEERALRPDYNLQEVAKPGKPLALENLARVAGLDIHALHQAVIRDDAAKVNTLQSRANQRLEKRFEEMWSQSSVKVRFFVSGSILKIQIEDEGTLFSGLDERSDGLRQFVALMAFTTRERATSPILLIDEAEAHLHYDAQADLIQMLASQPVASKVIYTTHSAGCLPEDLGTGVRMITPIEETPFSTFGNWFWSEGTPGFSPLLYGMGATTLAFFPMRRAVVVEGPTDMILLPSLLREATERESLGFQIVPGLSFVSRSHTSYLEHAGTSVVYLTDNDKGGAQLRDLLSDAGVEDTRVFRLAPAGTRAATIEDFIRPQVLIRAVNRLIDMHYEEVKSIEQSELPASGRVAILNEWFADQNAAGLSKRALAYEVLEICKQTPDVSILDERRRSILMRLYEEVTRLFGTY